MKDRIIKWLGGYTEAEKNAEVQAQRNRAYYDGQLETMRRYIIFAKSLYGSTEKEWNESMWRYMMCDRDKYFNGCE